jgi:hypothetical protein
MALRWRVEAAVTQLAADLASPRVYVIGSLRNDNVPEIARAIRAATGAEVFDSWHGAGPDADTYWREYEQGKGHVYTKALEEPLARKNFGFDKEWLDWCNVGVLVMPAGISGHLEIGHLTGVPNKRTFILLEEEPLEKWDLMYKLATLVTADLTEILIEIGVAE